MADSHTPLVVTSLVARIVRESELPSSRERDALRRELMAHFQDAAVTGEAAGAEAVERFGSPDAVAIGFRRAYRRGRRALYAAKVLASVTTATLFSLAMQLPLHLQLASGTIAVAPLYLLAALLSVVVVLIAVAAWELEVEWLCTRLERDPVLLVGCCLVLFVVLSATHAYRGMDVTSGRALLGAAMLVTVWTFSIAILSRADRLFVRLFGDAT